MAHTWATGEATWVSDYLTDTRFSPPAAFLATGVLEANIASAVTVAMRGRDHNHGILAALGYSPRVFSPHDVHFLQSMANILATCLEKIEAESALRESEERLRQSQKLEAIGLLAGGIAHDFNNLLTAVVGFSELLLTDFSADDPRRDYAEEIKKAGERAAALTRQLLAFSRRQVLQPRELDLSEVVEGVVQLLRRAATEPVEIVVSLSTSLGRVLADAHQLEQVLLNLTVNARDAMPQGGTLTIKTTNVEYTPPGDDSYEPAAYVLLSVGDTGTGMDEATQARIFEPFFTTKETGRGTGLGLATVYGIVKQSGGEIEVQSKSGQGTTFQIYLPAVAAGVAAMPAPEPAIEHATGTASGAATGRETILLVEDEDGVRALARTVLQSGGYTVLEADRGEEGLRLFETYDGRIDLLITDLVMPGMSGRELAERVLAVGRGTKVLYMSGYSNERLADLGDSYLQKPLNPQTLAQMVRAVLGTPSVHG